MADRGSERPERQCVQGLSLIHIFWGALKKKKAKYFSLGINHISCALSAAALLGTAGYCLTGMDTVDAGIAGKVVTAEDGRAWDENQMCIRDRSEGRYTVLLSGIYRRGHFGDRYIPYRKG